MTSNRNQPLSTSSEWTFELINQYYGVLDALADEYGLDCYPNQIELISSEQMLDAYSSVGMPVMYNHWSFGQQFLQDRAVYRKGYKGLAYEIVINSNPCIAYLMEENTMLMQILVTAHACFGHNSFFKGNYLFKQWTDAESIIDYLAFAKKYIAECEERYGYDEVESVIDACHALMNYGVDKYKRPPTLSSTQEEARRKERLEYLQSQVNEIWNTIPTRDSEASNDEERFPADPQENILYFIEKNAPRLEPWEREIVRIVRKIAQYFYPQRQTQVMNEGWATFWHYTLLNDLYDRGYINEGYMFEFLTSHTNVVMQPDFDSQYYGGINPYALGFAMFQDIKRICMEPTDEDKEWFPEFAGNGDWLNTIKFAMQNFKDESFISQYLSPKVMRDFKLFAISDQENDPKLEVSAIHNKQGYSNLRKRLSKNYNIGYTIPDIQVHSIDKWGDRSMRLRHQMVNDRPLAYGDTLEVLKHLRYLWGYDVYLESVNDKDEVYSLLSVNGDKTYIDVFTD